MLQTCSAGWHSVRCRRTAGAGPVVCAPLGAASGPEQPATVTLIAVVVCGWCATVCLGARKATRLLLCATSGTLYHTHGRAALTCALSRSHALLLAGRALETCILPVANALGNGYGIRACILLHSAQAPRLQPVGTQTFYTSLRAEQQCVVAIAAVQPAELLVRIAGHTSFEEYRWWKAAVGGDPDLGLQTWLDMEDTFRAFPLQPGDVLFLGGHTVQAGDPRMDGSPSLGLHWYL